MTTSKVVFVKQPREPSVAPSTVVLYARDNQLYMKDEAGQTTQVGVSATSLSDAGARSYNNANISIPGSAWTVVPQNAEDYDTHGYHSTAVNNSRMTVPGGQAGKYLVVFNAQFPSGIAGTYRGFRIYLNGATPIASNSGYVSNLEEARSLSVICQLSEGDYVEGFVYHNHSSPINLVYQAQISPYLMIQRAG